MSEQQKPNLEKYFRTYVTESDVNAFKKEVSPELADSFDVEVAAKLAHPNTDQVLKEFQKREVSSDDYKKLLSEWFERNIMSTLNSIYEDIQDRLKHRQNDNTAYMRLNSPDEDDSASSDDQSSVDLQEDRGIPADLRSLLRDSSINFGKMDDKHQKSSQKLQEKIDDLNRRLLRDNLIQDDDCFDYDKIICIIDVCKAAIDKVERNIKVLEEFQKLNDEILSKYHQDVNFIDQLNDAQRDLLDKRHQDAIRSIEQAKQTKTQMIAATMSFVQALEAKASRARESSIKIFEQSAKDTMDRVYQNSSIPGDQIVAWKELQIACGEIPYQEIDSFLADCARKEMLDDQVNQQVIETQYQIKNSKKDAIEKIELLQLQYNQIKKRMEAKYSALEQDLAKLISNYAAQINDNKSKMKDSPKNKLERDEEYAALLNKSNKFTQDFHNLRAQIIKDMEKISVCIKTSNTSSARHNNAFLAKALLLAPNNVSKYDKNIPVYGNIKRKLIHLKSLESELNGQYLNKMSRLYNSARSTAIDIKNYLKGAENKYKEKDRRNSMDEQMNPASTDGALEQQISNIERSSRNTLLNKVIQLLNSELCSLTPNEQQNTVTLRNNHQDLKLNLEAFNLEAKDLNSLDLTQQKNKLIEQVTAMRNTEQMSAITTTQGTTRRPLQIDNKSVMMEIISNKKNQDDRKIVVTNDGSIFCSPSTSKVLWTKRAHSKQRISALVDFYQLLATSQSLEECQAGKIICINLHEYKPSALKKMLHILAKDPDSLCGINLGNAWEDDKVDAKSQKKVLSLRNKINAHNRKVAINAVIRAQKQPAATEEVESGFMKAASTPFMTAASTPKAKSSAASGGYDQVENLLLRASEKLSQLPTNEYGTPKQKTLTSLKASTAFTTALTSPKGSTSFTTAASTPKSKSSVASGGHDQVLRRASEKLSQALTDKYGTRKQKTLTSPQASTAFATALTSPKGSTGFTTALSSPKGSTGFATPLTPSPTARTSVAHTKKKAFPAMQDEAGHQKVIKGDKSTQTTDSQPVEKLSVLAPSSKGSSININSRRGRFNIPPLTVELPSPQAETLPSLTPKILSPKDQSSAVVRLSAENLKKLDLAQHSGDLEQVRLHPLDEEQDAYHTPLSRASSKSRLSNSQDEEQDAYRTPSSGSSSKSRFRNSHDEEQDAFGTPSSGSSNKSRSSNSQDDKSGARRPYQLSGKGTPTSAKKGTPAIGNPLIRPKFPRGPKSG